ncbi:MurR/RpiR family transcriptional regulator [Nonomuraea fuscirosea]|uniref:RpiR family transcriptional regulator n=1 Tax=Nonomuraea fuscirosea TaxID=1291556 RepID=A0A2T0N9Y8_9ACTN|nr:MurR/RpiR family transcriptional regulator [Nonomuraea fuscirosea]PRX69599.1 RpiR family transcriptional regulator [Nonomuraea fuscirosea]WSA48924.1 MurR/RpiR family transcriptional regulator [Nonomuraea fuscirosea]
MTEGAVVPEELGSADSYEDWLRERLPVRGLRGKAAAVLEVLLSQPRRASFGSAQELAQLAGVNVATVTRTAQALGFAGWPALQQELRARYLSSLSAGQVAAEHRGTGSPSSRSLRRDLDSLAVLNRRLDESVLLTIAEAMAAARHTVIVADGSYAAVGLALAHNARLAGYPVRAVTAGDAELANAMAAIGEGDVLIAISFWRLYQSTVLAANEARSRGVRVFALTDAASPALASAAEQVVIVPAEGEAFFPSLTAGIAVAQALVTQLAAVDPARTGASIEAAEAMWAKFGLLHRRPTAGDPS